MNGRCIVFITVNTLKNTHVFISKCWNGHVNKDVKSTCLFFRSQLRHQYKDIWCFDILLPSKEASILWARMNSVVWKKCMALSRARWYGVRLFRSKYARGKSLHYNYFKSNQAITWHAYFVTEEKVQYGPEIQGYAWLEKYTPLLGKVVIMFLLVYNVSPRIYCIKTSLLSFLSTYYTEQTESKSTANV